MFQSVQYQYLPARYGGEYDQLSEEKWNIVVLSIEGFLSAIKSFDIEKDTAIIVNLHGNFVSREGRNSDAEGNLNAAVLRHFIKNNIFSLNGVSIPYIDVEKEEINEKVLSENSVLLKLIR